MPKRLVKLVTHVQQQSLERVSYCLPVILAHESTFSSSSLGLCCSSEEESVESSPVATPLVLLVVAMMESASFCISVWVWICAGEVTFVLTKPSCVLMSDGALLNVLDLSWDKLSTFVEEGQNLTGSRTIWCIVTSLLLTTNHELNLKNTNNPTKYAV